MQKNPKIGKISTEVNKKSSLAWKAVNVKSGGKILTKPK